MFTFPACTTHECCVRLVSVCVCVFLLHFICFAIRMRHGAHLRPFSVRNVVGFLSANLMDFFFRFSLLYSGLSANNFVCSIPRDRLDFRSFVCCFCFSSVTPPGNLMWFSILRNWIEHFHLIYWQLCVKVCRRTLDRFIFGYLILDLHTMDHLTKRIFAFTFRRRWKISLEKTKKNLLTNQWKSWSRKFFWRKLR